VLLEGKGLGNVALALNFSVGQRLQIVNLLQPMRSQLTTILTPEQLQQLQQNLQSLQQQARP
jgi:hypothetical protein